MMRYAMASVNHRLTAIFYFGRGHRFGEAANPGLASYDPLEQYAVHSGIFIPADAHGGGKLNYAFGLGCFGFGFYFEFKFQFL